MSDQKERTVFEVLSQVNVNDKIVEKDGFKYLSWSDAWSEFKKKYDGLNYKVRLFDGKPYIYDENTGYMVFTEVTLGDTTYEMFLPVLDIKNKPMKKELYKYKVKYQDKNTRQWLEVEKTVESATMFDINKALMRCLVKNLALFGLGIYIYQGDDIPSDSDKHDEAKPQTQQPDPISFLTPHQDITMIAGKKKIGATAIKKIVKDNNYDLVKIKQAFENYKGE